MYQLLNGMTVVEGASFVAAPSAGLYLAQMGAEVIRFDQIGGGPDFNRWPVADNGASFYWEGLNKGKKSIAVDLRSEEGRELVSELICAPDDNKGLFLTNYPEQGFLAHDTLKAKRDDLITVRVMGQRDARPALDYTVNCAVGYPYMTGPEALDAPVNHVLPAWDLLCGSYAAFAMVTAERHRRMGGPGHEVKVPLSDMAAATLSNLGQIGEVSASDEDREKVGNSIYGMFGRDFQTRDKKRIMLVVVTPVHWKKLIALLGFEEAAAALEAELGVDLAKDEGARFTHRAHFFPLIEKAVAAMDYDALVEMLEAAGLVWGPYRTVREAIADPFTVAENPMFSNIRQASGFSYPVAGAPGTLSDVTRDRPQPAPLLGRDTEQILLEHMRLSSATVGDLIDRQIVAPA